MDPTQIPQKGLMPGGIDPNAIKAILAKLFGGPVQPGAPTFPGAGGAPPAQGASPAGMTQPQPAPPVAASAPAPAGATQPAAAIPPTSAGVASRPGPTGGGPPQPTGAKPQADATEEGFPSESAWAAAHPTPQQQPYQAPDLKRRMLMGLFAGLENLGKPGSGNEELNQYLNRIYQGEEANRTLPERNAAAAHQAYMTAAEGAKQPIDIESAQAELENRRALAQLNRAKAAAAASPTANLQRAVIDDPKNPGTPRSVDFNPKTGQYVDPDTRDVIQGAKPWEKPVTQTGITPAQIIEQEVGPPPSPKDFPNGEKDPGYIAAREAYGKKAEEAEVRLTAAQGSARGEAYGEWRPVQTIDPATGELRYTFAKQAVAEGAAPAAQGAASERRQSLVNDITQSIGRVRDNLDVFNQPALQKANLAASLADPHSTAGQFLQTVPRGSLNEKQQEAVADLFNLREQVMAMRAVLGAGQGAEDMRRAILAAIPGVATPNSKFGARQLDDLQASLRKLGQGIPGVKGGPKKEEQTPEKSGEGKYHPGFHPD